MKNYAFYIFLGLVSILLVVLSVISKEESTAMVARVESRVLAVSYENPVRVEKIEVVPGQRVKQGDVLVKVTSPKIDLDIEQKKNQLSQLNLEISAIEEEYRGRISQIRTEMNAKIQEEKSELDLINLEFSSKSNSGRIISEIIGGVDRVDSAAVLEIKKQELVIDNLKSQLRSEVQRMEDLQDSRIKILVSEKEILLKELDAIHSAQEKLVYKAEQDGTVGNLYVELNELVRPFDRILTLYELKPSMIKAYADENIVATLQVGQKVRAKAANREIFTYGTIEEFGTRVTDYPAQITEGVDMRYGQEVFIRIPQEHAFLDGEKVFVYPDGDQ